MKKLFVFLSISIFVFACNFVSSSAKPKSRGEAVSPTPDNDCPGNRYKPKSEAEISAKTPRQLFEELVKANPNSFESYVALRDYESSIERHFRKERAAALPVLNEYINAYDPSRASRCDDMRFSVAARMANDIDRFEFRLRAAKEGRLVIEALERAIQRIHDAGYDTNYHEYSQNSRHPLSSLFLKELEGVNEVDKAIRNTFWTLHKIEMSDVELFEFSNFLILRDPTYPAWSGQSLIKDYSRLNEAGNPLQVFVVKKPERYYAAYLEFKKQR